MNKCVPYGWVVTPNSRHKLPLDKKGLKIKLVQKKNEVIKSMKEQDLEVTTEKVNDKIRFILRGRISLITAPTLQFKLDEAMKNGEMKIILNMLQVSFLSSAGIRIILKTHKKATENGGSFGIEDPSENVKNVIGMTALDELLI